jgi:hypothetical protein
MGASPSRRSGEPSNMEQFKAFSAPGGAKKRWAELAAQVK